MDAYDMSFFNQIFSGEGTPGGISSPNKTITNPQNIQNIQNMQNQRQMPSLSEMPTTPFPKETPIAMAYVPYQMWEKPYDDAVALSRGTIFPSLDKPFIGEEAVKDARKR